MINKRTFVYILCTIKIFIIINKTLSFTLESEYTINVKQLDTFWNDISNVIQNRGYKKRLQRYRKGHVGTYAELGPEVSVRNMRRRR